MLLWSLILVIPRSELHYGRSWVVVNAWQLKIWKPLFVKWNCDHGWILWQYTVLGQLVAVQQLHSVKTTVQIPVFCFGAVWKIPGSYCLNFLCQSEFFWMCKRVLTLLLFPRSSTAAATWKCVSTWWTWPCMNPVIRLWVWWQLVTPCPPVVSPRSNSTATCSCSGPAWTLN